MVLVKLASESAAIRRLFRPARRDHQKQFKDDIVRLRAELEERSGAWATSPSWTTAAGTRSTPASASPRRLSLLQHRRGNGEHPEGSALAQAQKRPSWS